LAWYYRITGIRSVKPEQRAGKRRPCGDVGEKHGKEVFNTKNTKNAKA